MAENTYVLMFEPFANLAGDCCLISATPKSIKNLVKFDFANKEQIEKCDYFIRLKVFFLYVMVLHEEKATFKYINRNNEGGATMGM